MKPKRKNPSKRNTHREELHPDDVMLSENALRLLRDPKLKLTTAEKAIYSVLWLPESIQDKRRREGVIPDDLFALAKHYRWRGVCSGGGRVRGTTIVGYGMWRRTFQSMFRQVESRMKRKQAVTP